MYLNSKVKKEFKKDNLNFSQTNENNIHDLKSQQNENNRQNTNTQQTERKPPQLNSFTLIYGYSSE